jgi:hypothetical protein
MLRACPRHALPASPVNGNSLSLGESQMPNVWWQSLLAVSSGASALIS